MDNYNKNLIQNTINPAMVSSNLSDDSLEYWNLKRDQVYKIQREYNYNGESYYTLSEADRSAVKVKVPSIFIVRK